MELLKPSSWIIVSISSLLVYAVVCKGMSYINCWKIFKQYKKIFEIDGKIEYKHFLFFMLFPIPLALASSLHVAVELSTNSMSDYGNNLLNTLGIIVSILTATLYMYLGTISQKHNTITNNNNIDADSYERFEKLHNETVSIINYEVLISIALLILCFIKPTFNSCNPIFYQIGNLVLGLQWVLDTLIFYLFYSFILNLLIVTKRFNILSGFKS